MAEPLSDNEFDLFRYLFKKKVGITLPPGKRNSLGRKIAARAKALSLPSNTAYYRFIRKPEGEEEFRALIGAVTVDQTSFFRGGRQFAYIEQTLVPDLLEVRNAQKRLRIWSAACARGQEPYSMAMILAEHARLAFSWDVKILATDVDQEKLKEARRGVYGPEIAREVPFRYLDRCFGRETGPDGRVRYVVRKAIRETVAFRRLNLLEFPYPLKGPVDLILCKNVMIYFSTRDKRRILEELHGVLAPDGYLCLGGSESLLGVDPRFALVGHAIYRKKGA